MAKANVLGIKIPKKVLGFKLSKGSRKDLRKLLKRLEGSEARALAISALGAGLAYVADRKGNGAAAPDKRAGKGSVPSQPN